MKVLIAAGTFLTIILSALGQLGRIEVLGGAASFYVFEIPLLFTWLLMFWQYRNKPFETVRFHNLGIATRLLFGYLGVSLVVSFLSYSRSENSVAIMYFFRLATYLLFIVYTFYFFYEQKVTKAYSLALIFLFTAIIVLSGAIQYWLYPDLRNLFYAGWDPHYYRLFGLYFEPVIAASIYGILLIFMFLYEKVSWVVRGPIIAVLSVMILATYSRAAWLALLVACCVLAIRYKAIKYISVVAIILGVVFILLPKPSGEGVNIMRTSTIFSRVTDYEEGIHIWQKQPLLGIGYNHLSAEKVQSKTTISGVNVPNNAAGSLHSSFLIFLATGGVVGLLVSINWLAALAKKSSFLFYAVIFLSVASLFDNVVLHPFVLVALAVFGGLSITRPSDTSP